MNITFLYSSGRLIRVDRIATSEAADDFLYGAIELQARGHNIKMVELPATTKHRSLRLLGKLLFNLRILPHKMDGDLLSQVYAALPQLAAADVIIVAGTPLALSLTTFHFLRFLKAPIVGIHAGIFNYSLNNIQTFILRHLTKRHWVIIFGNGEKKRLHTLIGQNLQHQIVVNYCGIDTNFWTPKPFEPEYILALGNDSQRDYQTLLDAAKHVSFPFLLITRKYVPDDLPSNVTLLSGDMRQEIISDVALREIYRKAACVVIPLLETLQPSGQSVCLQAMACGIPVIMTNTSGIWDATKLHDGVNILLVSVGGTSQIITHIEKLLSDRKYSQTIAENGLQLTLNEWNMEQWTDVLERVCIQCKNINQRR
jgi:glycosyltransferase involved in cell wall biosynthesis